MQSASFVQIPTIKHSDLPDETLSTSQGVLHVKLTMTKMDSLTGYGYVGAW